MVIVHAGFRTGALLIGLALTACGSDTATIEGENGERADYTFDAETGEASAVIRSGDGTTTLRSGADIPVDLPTGFSLFPGAQITTNTVFDDGGGKSVILTMTSAADSERIVRFYREQAEDAGFAIEVDATINGGRMLTGKNEEGRSFSINTMPGDDYTSATLAIGGP
ncbi:MAG: hypothetical protein WA918_09490 [Erythrobacter sp.]